MKILHVVPYFKPSWEAGGPPRSVYEISYRQAKLGHDVTVYTTDGFKRRINVVKNRAINVDGINVYYFRNLSIFLSSHNIPLPYYMPIVARKEIKDYDIVHIHEFRNFLALVAYYYARKYNVPYVLQPRGSAPRFSKTIRKKIFDFVGSKIFYNACRIIASSKIESRQYKKVFPKVNMSRVVHIPNGINPWGLPKKGRFKKKFGIEGKMILYLGRIHERKGLDLLIKAYSKLNNEDVTLVIAGPDDHYLGKLKKLIKKIDKKVVLTGPIYGKEKIEAYTDADVFVLPSRDYYESFGNVVLEAMVCGTPVIVTKYCGISEWINDEVGRIINYDVNELVKALKELLSYNSRSKVRKFALSKFTWDNVVKETMKVYEQCI